MNEKKVDFEALFKELEEIVDKMEKGDVSLTQSLELFERGIKISKILREELDSIERKVELLLKDDLTGEITREPFEEEKDTSNDELPF